MVTKKKAVKKKTASVRKPAPAKKPIIAPGKAARIESTPNVASKEPLLKRPPPQDVLPRPDERRPPPYPTTAQREAEERKNAKAAIVIDCETTGLTLPALADISKQPCIIELAVARIEGGVITRKDTWMFKPSNGLPLEEIITKITGLTDADLADKPSFASKIEEIEAAFAGADVLFAHNAPFDCDCILYELLRMKRQNFPWPSLKICTVQEYRHEFGYRPKMTELYQKKIGKPLEQKHRAMDDVLALCEIVIAEKLV